MKQFDPRNKIRHGLNDKQIEAVLTDDSRVLVLAGAGKTATNIRIILNLVFEKNVKSSRILAVTFTKFVANEKGGHLILEAGRDNGEYQVILENRELTKDKLDQYRRQYQCKYTWVSNLTVRTFHSFSYNVLSTCGSINLDNKFKIISEKSSDKDTLSSRVADESSADIYLKTVSTLIEGRTFLLKLKRYIIEYYVDEIQKKQE